MQNIDMSRGSGKTKGSVSASQGFFRRSVNI